MERARARPEALANTLGDHDAPHRGSESHPYQTHSVESAPHTVRVCVCAGLGQTSPWLDSHRPCRETCRGTIRHGRVSKLTPTAPRNVRGAQSGAWSGEWADSIRVYIPTFKIKSSASREQTVTPCIARLLHLQTSLSTMDGEEQLRHTQLLRAFEDGRWPQELFSKRSMDETLRRRSY